MWERSVLILAVAASLAVASAAEAKKADAAAGLFNGTIHTLRIDVPDASLAALRQNNRAYVRATLSDGKVELRDVGLRLKGHSTFQPLDQKPALTIKFNEFISGQEFYG